jgi:hypothetical protein
LSIFLAVECPKLKDAPLATACALGELLLPLPLRRRATETLGPRAHLQRAPREKAIPQPANALVRHNPTHDLDVRQVGCLLLDLEKLDAVTHCAHTSSAAAHVRSRQKDINCVPRAPASSKTHATAAPTSSFLPGDSLRPLAGE